MKKVFFVITGFISALNLWAQQYPFQDPMLSSEERAGDLIARLTLEEKAALMCDIAEPIPRLAARRI